MNIATTTGITAIIRMSPLEAEGHVAALNEYLSERGHALFTLSPAPLFGTPEQVATAHLEQFTEDDQLDLLDVISELPWQFPETGYIRLLPLAIGKLH